MGGLLWGSVTFLQKDNSPLCSCHGRVWKERSGPPACKLRRESHLDFLSLESGMRACRMENWDTESYTDAHEFHSSWMTSCSVFSYKRHCCVRYDFFLNCQGRACTLALWAWSPEAVGTELCSPVQAQATCAFWAHQMWHFLYRDVWLLWNTPWIAKISGERSKILIHNYPMDDDIMK